jgi:hypothetical protein
MYNTRFVRPLKILGVLYLAYLALMLLVLTPALNIATPKIYRAQTGRELHLEKIIWLNPFTLAVNVRGASSDNPDRSRFWSFDKLYANLSLSSLWRGQLVLDAVQLQGLYLQIDQTSAERYNFSDIIDHQAQLAAGQTQPAETPTQTGGDIFPLSIGKIELNAAHLGLRAPHLSEPLAAEINNTTIHIDRFSTVAEQKAAAHNAGNDKPNIHSGPIAVAIGYIKADLLREQQPFAAQIDNLQFALENFSSAAQPNQNYKLNAKFHDGGELQTQGKFDLAARRNNGEVHLRNINLLPAWRYLAPKLAFETQSGTLDADIPYDLSWGEALRYRIANGRAALRSAQLQALRDADTKLGFTALGAEGINVDSAQPRAQIAKITLDGLTVAGWNKDTQISLLDMFQFAGSDEPSERPVWQIQIDEVATSNGRLQWRASQLDIPELVAAPLELHATNIHWPATDAAQFNFKTALNNDTQIALQGALNPADLTGKLSGEIAGLPLRWGNRLLGEQMRATLQSGSASARFELAIDKGQPTTLLSDGRVDELELQRLPDQQKLLAWKQLQWKKLALNLPAQTLKIDQISAAKPWLQFRLNADGTNNFQQLTIAQANTPGEKTATKSATKPAPARNVKAAEKPWLFTVRNIHSDNGTLDFRDNSLPRAFHTTIADFTGDLDGLSNRPGALAKVGFKGTVDGYAPVALTGTVNPFAETPALNVALDITNLDLAMLTPYSGIYAGYTINGGRLSVQLAYTLENRRVKGTNHIIVNQLELGEQVKGPKVMDLPLRFAIYLLTDANGVMDLGVDVTGNVDDPDFSVASIIWKALRNVIVKTATSPFRALGRLAGGVDEDLDRIEFAPGSDQIAAASAGKLNSLAEALQKKTALRLNISGHVSPWQDIEALRDNSLSQQLIAQDGITATDIQQQSKGWQKAVAKLYGKRFPADRSGKLETMQMNDAMRDNIELEPRALDELAGRRALAVKQALVTDRGLGADRATIAPIDLGADKNPGLQVTLTLE